MLIQEQTIYPNREHGLTRFYAVQNESNAKELRFNLCDSRGIPVDVSTSKAFLHVIKPDRNVVMVECTAGEKASQMKCLLTLQAATCPGLCKLFLQVFTDAGELRYDNMELQVFPAEVDRIASTSDLAPLAKLIQSAGSVEALLKLAQDTTGLMAEVLQNYIRALSLEASGTIDIGEESPSVFGSSLGVDTQGNILMIDSRTWGGVHTKLSTDYCQNWQPAPLQPAGASVTEVFQNCIAGEKFLCVGDNHLLWAQVNQAGTFSSGPLLANPMKNKISPFIHSGKYLKGKYWVFRNHDWTVSNPVAYPPAYFTGSGTEYVEISLPDNQIDPWDIIYDPTNACYFMAGGYVPNTPNSGLSVILKSKDAVNWSVWKKWNSGSYEIYALTILNGILSAYPRYSAKNCLTVYRLDLSALLENQWETVNTPYKEDVYTLNAASCGVCSAAAAENCLAYTKDGHTDTLVSLSWPGEPGGALGIAGYGRHMVLTYGPYYTVYRVNLVGEDLSGNLDKIEQAYLDYLETARQEVETVKSETELWREHLSSELEVAAGRKIMITDTDPGIGSAAEPGTIIFVCE